jgi:hypothetical protein
LSAEQRILFSIRHKAFCIRKVGWQHANTYTRDTPICPKLPPERPRGGGGLCRARVVSARRRVVLARRREVSTRRSKRRARRSMVLARRGCVLTGGRVVRRGRMHGGQDGTRGCVRRGCVVLARRRMDRRLDSARRRVYRGRMMLRGRRRGGCVRRRRVVGRGRVHRGRDGARGQVVTRSVRARSVRARGVRRRDRRVRRRRDLAALLDHLSDLHAVSRWAWSTRQSEAHRGTTAVARKDRHGVLRVRRVAGVDDAQEDGVLELGRAEAAHVRLARGAGRAVALSEAAHRACYVQMHVRICAGQK